jgi:CHAT domain-containing protein
MPLSETVLLQIFTGKGNAFYQLSRGKTNPYRDLEASLSNYGLAFQLINNMRNGYNIEDTKLLLSETTKKYYAQALHVALEFDKLYPSGENSIRPFEFIEKGKGATMAASFNEHKARHFAGIPDPLLDNEKGLQGRIGFYTVQVANQKYQKGGYDTLKVNAWENEKFTCSRKLDSLVTFFETNYPAYYEFKYANNVASIPEIQKSLDDNTAILEYLVGDSSLFIATITDSLYKIIKIPTDSSFTKLVAKYYRDIKIAEPGSFAANSHHIYEKLVKPVEVYISHKGKLVIVPDDYLYYVPFETLVDNVPATKSQDEDFSKLDYLIKTHSISYHHSATLWSNSNKNGNEIAAKQKVNFIGFAPVFSKEKNNGIILSSNISAIDTTGNDLAYRSISTDLKSFNPLPNSKEEVVSIVHLFEKRRKEAKVYLYSEASESNFKNNIKGYSIVHIASHGFSNDKEPELSGIVFSQPGDTSEKEDGILYAGETYSLNLSADLIVLSSCESGLGKLVKGEGLQALSRGFLYAGASNVMFSLWKVLDKPTEGLMLNFYSNVLDGKPYAESLRQAKLKLINDPKTAFPHFWGGFLLVGK